MERIFIIGDSYSHGFLDFFKYIKTNNIKTHIFYDKYDLNFKQSLETIQKINNSDDDKKLDDIQQHIQKLIKDIEEYKPTIIIFNIGNIDFNQLYFYNAINNIPYDVNNNINDFMNIIRLYTTTCKKAYVVSPLPLFVNDIDVLKSDFLRFYCKDLYNNLSEDQINVIFDIDKYRKQLNKSNDLLRKKIQNINLHTTLTFIDFNKYIINDIKRDNNISYNKAYYIRKEKIINTMLPLFRFHINPSQYMETLLQNNLIPELNNEINNFSNYD